MRTARSSRGLVKLLGFRVPKPPLSLDTVSLQQVSYVWEKIHLLLDLVVKPCWSPQGCEVQLLLCHHLSHMRLGIFWFSAGE